MKHTMPTSLRKPEARLAARAMADAMLRADRRRQRRAQAIPRLDKKAAPTPPAGRQPLRLTDLKRALAARRRLQGE
jgi:hypothetical protein